MFTLKAEVDPRDGSGVRNVTFFSADQIHVRRSLCNSSSGMDHDWEIELRDRSGAIANVVKVGPALEHYCLAYIMNERGKTVDHVVSRPPKA